MKKLPTLFLKLVIFFIGIGAFAALIRFPQTEGRAANLDLISIYTDPLIIYVYIASIPFFVALFQAINLLGFIEKDTIFSQLAVNVVKNIKYCAISIICFLVVAMVWIRLASGNDDPAGAMAVGIGMILISTVAATASIVFQKVLQNAVDRKRAH